MKSKVGDRVKVVRLLDDFPPVVQHIRPRLGTVGTLTSVRHEGCGVTFDEPSTFDGSYHDVVLPGEMELIT